MAAELERYSVIDDKNPREIVLLRGAGCAWRRCRFCDYHLDFCKNDEENFTLNKSVLEMITGKYEKLEVINSGSFVDLDEKTLKYIETVCLEKKIKELHFECHYLHRDAVKAFKKRFEDLGITVYIKIGVETFDALFRESYLDKGIVDEKGAPVKEAKTIAAYFDECCLLFGIPGQTIESMEQDIQTGLSYFRRICINIMVENGKPILPDPKVIELFVKELYPRYKDNDRVDILLNNTDFGVGAEKCEK